MSTALTSVISPSIFSKQTKPTPAQFGPHYYRNPAYFRNMPNPFLWQEFYFHPIDFDFQGLELILDTGHKVELTGRVFGQGSASTAFEAILTDGSGKPKTVALKVRDHATIPTQEANVKAADEIKIMSDVDQAKIGRLKYYGQTQINGMTASVMSVAPGMGWNEVPPRWINKTTFREVSRMFDLLEAKGFHPGDFEFNIDNRGRVYLVDPEGLQGNPDYPTTRQEVFDDLNGRRQGAGLKPLELPKSRAGMTPKKNLYGSSYRGFFRESGVNMGIGLAGFGATKAIESLIGRKLTGGEALTVNVGPFIPVMAYSTAKNFIAARSAGSGFWGALGKSGTSLGKGVGGGFVAGFGASLMLGDLGVDGDAHTLGTIGLGSVGASHPAGIAFFAGYGVGKFLDWGTGKVFGARASDKLADGIEWTVDSTVGLYKSIHPTHRRIARRKKQYEAQRERDFRAAVRRAKRFQADQKKARESHSRVENLSNAKVQVDSQAVLDYLKQANDEIKKGEVKMDYLENLQAIAGRGGSLATVEILDFHERGAVSYKITLRDGFRGDKVIITWRMGYEPYMETIEPGTLGYYN